MPGPKPLRFRVTVSPQAHPALYRKLAALPTQGRPQEIVALASDAGADPRLLASLDRIAGALEAGLAAGLAPHGESSGGAPSPGATPPLPPGFDTEDWS